MTEQLLVRRLEVELLGVPTMSQKRMHSDKELQRFEACLRSIRLFSYVRLPFAWYLKAVMAYVIVKLLTIGFLVGRPCN